MAHFLPVPAQQIIYYMLGPTFHMHSFGLGRTQAGPSCGDYRYRCTAFVVSLFFLSSLLTVGLDQAGGA